MPKRILESQHIPVWALVKTHLEERIVGLHFENEKDLSDQATAKIRGRIAEIRKLIITMEPKIPVTR